MDNHFQPDAPEATPGGRGDDAPRAHLAYLTANDVGGFPVDLKHFRNMTRRDPGVGKVSVTIAISRVRPVSAADRRAVDALVSLAARCPWLELREVIWKGNVGRDFSSAAACLRSIATVARDDDYVMVRNRSGYGPLCDGWFLAYVRQFERFPGTGLVGSTINLAGHPARPDPDGGPSVHVQTYAYLSQWRHLRQLVDEYPASRCIDRIQLIVEGEIGLSRRMMSRGLGLSCLHWHDRFFDAHNPPDASLPRHDIKETVAGVPIRYKYPGYSRERGRVARWTSRLWGTLRRPRSSRGARIVPQVELHGYD